MNLPGTNFFHNSLFAKNHLLSIIAHISTIFAPHHLLIHSINILQTCGSTGSNSSFFHRRVTLWDLVIAPNLIRLSYDNLNNSILGLCIKVFSQVNNSSLRGSNQVISAHNMNCSAVIFCISQSGNKLSLSSLVALALMYSQNITLHTLHALCRVSALEIHLFLNSGIHFSLTVSFLQNQLSTTALI